MKIGRAENIQTRDERGVINSFVTTEWGGQIQRTQTILDSFVPEFAQTFYYEIPLFTKKALFESKHNYRLRRKRQLE